MKHDKGNRQRWVQKSRCFNRFLSNGIVACTLLLLASTFLLAPASARLLYVSKAGDGTTGLSWQTAKTSISDAIDIAESGDDIWVAGGEYNESIQTSHELSLYGGFAGTEAPEEFALRDITSYSTVVDATGMGISCLSAINVAGLTVDGFLLTGGNNLYGGGVYLENASASIRHCHITRNTADDGSGVYIKDATMVLDGCIITANRGFKLGIGISRFGGGVYCTGAYLAMHTCRISDHNSANGAVYLVESNADISESTVDNNHATNGGGIFSMLSTLHLSNSVISNNTCDYVLSEGAGIRSYGNTRIEDCTITANHGVRGGGIYMDGTGNRIVSTQICHNTAKRGAGLMSRVRESTSISRCVIASNTAQHGGGVYAAAGQLLFEQCTITENKAHDLDITGGGGGLCSPRPFLRTAQFPTIGWMAMAEPSISWGGV